VSYQVPRYAHGSRVPGWDDAVDTSKDPSEVPDPATTFVPDELRAEIEASMAKYPDRRSATLPALHAAQRLHGWCSPEAIEQVACVMRLTPGYMTAVATFYDMFDTEPVGRHRVYVCTNISCSLHGGDDLYHALHAAADGDADVNVRHFECLGACDIAPMASVDGVYVGPIELDEVDQLLDDVRNGRPPLPAKQLINRPAADTLPIPSGDAGTGTAEAHRATPDAAIPSAPTSYGGEMEGDLPGPSAPLEGPDATGETA
jgi:NADH:ubiquinone oxidoreductase subunit E